MHRRKYLCYYLHMMEKAEIEKIKSELESRYELITKEVEKIELEAKEGEEPQIEDIDRASAEAASLEEASRIENLKIEKEAIKRTIDKINNNKFGICEKCGKQMDKARIEIIPTARLCMSCKIICDNCGEEIEEALILGKNPPLICQNCQEEVDPEVYFTSSSIIPPK